MAAAARHLDPGHQRLKVLADVPLEHLDFQGAGIGRNEVEHRFHGAGDLWLAEWVPDRDTHEEKRHCSVLRAGDVRASGYMTASGARQLTAPVGSLQRDLLQLAK
jgi:hypothetical protein